MKNKDWRLNFRKETEATYKNKSLNLTLFMFAIMLSFNLFAQCPTNIDLCGQAAITCFPGINNNGTISSNAVLGIVDIRDRSATTPGALWTAAGGNNINHPSNWNATNLGLVFGLAIGCDKNVYTTATTVYGCQTGNFNPYGPAGPAGIYKVDPVSGSIQTFVTTAAFLPGKNQIPNTGSGLGNICYDRDHDQFFVTNFSDGMIYRISATGAVIDRFDPFTTNNIPSTDDANFVTLGERPWGIGYNHIDGRLYFSNWRQDRLRRTAGVYNEIWSVGLNPDGSFTASGSGGTLNGGDQKEFDLPDNIDIINPNIFFDYSNPISDVTFSESGDMLLAERTMYGDCGKNQVSGQENNFAHGARVLEYYYSDLSNIWHLTPGHSPQNNGISFVDNETDLKFLIGIFNDPSPSVRGIGTNSAGGIDYGYGSFSSNEEPASCDAMVWSSADYMQNNCTSGFTWYYGLQGLNASGGNQCDSYIIDYDGTPGSNDKNLQGDVEIFKCFSCPARTCELDLSIAVDTSCTEKIFSVSSSGLTAQTDIYWTIDDLWFYSGGLNENVSLSNQPDGNYTICASVSDGICQTEDCVDIVIGCSPCVSPSFLKLYGDNTNNAIAKIEQHNNALYSLGFKTTTHPDVNAIFMKTDLNGNIIWETQLPETYRMHDFIYANDGFILVGATQPFDNGSRSLICKINGDGTLIWSKEYDFGRRESLTRIASAPSSGGSLLEFYVLGIIVEPQTFNQDDVILLKIDEDGDEIFRKSLDNSGEDDQLQSDFLRLENGKYIFMGSKGSFALLGVMDEFATKAYFSGDGSSGYELYDAIEANEKVYIVGKTNTSAYLLVLNQAGTQKVARYILPNLTAAYRIQADNDENLYISGTSNDPNTLNLPLIYKLNESFSTGNSTGLTTEWAKGINNSESAFGFANITITDDQKMLYADNRQDAPGSFGAHDAMIAVFDLNMGGECTIDTFAHMITGPSVVAEDITTNFTITDEPFPIPSTFDINTNGIYRSAVIDCIPLPCDSTDNCQEAPIFTTCEDYIFEATIDNCQAFFDCTRVIAIDPCTLEELPVDCVRSDGESQESPYPIGTTTVIASVTNSMGQKATCEFNINVIDNIPPIIACPANITVECSDDISPENTGMATATDNCSEVSITFFDDSTQGLFGCNEYNYSITRIWTAIDALGNAIHCNQEIEVKDSTPPVFLDCPSDYIVQAAPGQAEVNLKIPYPSFTDNCSGVTLNCDFLTDQSWPCGITKATCIATDECENTITCSFNVIVECSESCCQPEIEFCEKFEQGFYSSTPKQCDLKICPAGLDSCDLINIDWGDMTTGRMGGDECMTHTYTESGNYEICLTALQLQADDTVCNQKDTCWTVCIECEACDELEWNHLWSKGIGSITDATGLSNFESHAYDLSIKNGEIYYAGMIEGTDLDGMLLNAYGGIDAYVAKYTLTGVPLWAFTIGGGFDDGITAIDVDSNTGDIYVGGWFKSQTLMLPSPGAGTTPITLHKSTSNISLEDGFYAKYDSNRNLQWAYSFGGLGYDMVMDLVVDHNGNIALTGAFWYDVLFYEDGGSIAVSPAPSSMTGGEVEVFVLKIDPNGNHIWTEVLGDPLLRDWAQAIAVDESNDIYVSGQFSGKMHRTGGVQVLSTSSTRSDAFITKFSELGDYQWSMNISGSDIPDPATNVAFDLAVHDNKLIATGQANGMNMNFNPSGTPHYLSGNESGNLHGFLACYNIDTDLNSIPPLDWAFLLNTNGQSNDLSVNIDGDIAITGSSFRQFVDFDPSGNDSNTLGILYQDHFIAKYTLEGEYINAMIFGGSSWDKSHAVEWDDSSNVYSIGKFGSSNFDAEPFNPENDLISANGRGEIFMGKYTCFCNATDICCDDLSASYETLSTDTCCYSLNIENNFGTSICQIQVEMISDNWLFSQTTIPFLNGYEWGSTNRSQLVSIVHELGVIPSGEISDILNYCIVPLDSLNMDPVEVVVKWWEGFPGNKKKIICRDTLLLDCAMENEEACLDFQLIEAVCDPENPLEYDLFYTVTNLGDVDAVAIILENLSNDFVFGSCTNGGATTDVYFESIDLQPGETSAPLCASISTTQPILSTTEISLTTGFIGSTCCHSNIEQSFEIIPCCLLCEQVTTSIKSDSICCYSFGLSSECAIPYFTKVELQIEGISVLFNTFENNSPNDWEMSSNTPSNITLTPTAGFIEDNSYDNIVSFCLEGNPSGSENVFINFYSLNAEGVEILECREISVVECNSEVGSCATIIDTSFVYNLDENHYELTIDVVNNSDFDANYLVFTSPLGNDIIFDNSFISLNPGLLASGGSTTVSTIFTTNPSPYFENVPIPIGIALKNVANEDCCLENPSLMVVNVEELHFSNKMIAYPNPFAESFTILFNQPTNQTLELRLLDIHGRVLDITQVASGSKLFDFETNNLASGVYFLGFMDLQDNMAVIKMIKI